MSVNLERLHVPVLSLLTLAFALLLHEAGHALAGYVTGGSIVDLVLWSSMPHVVIAGQASWAVQAWRTAAGSGLPLVSFFCLILLLGWNRSIITQTLSLFCLIEITGWVSSALCPGDSQDDATLFLACTGIPGVLLAAICVLVSAAAVWIIALRSRALNSDVDIRT